MKVKVIKAEYNTFWYANLLGEVFDADYYDDRDRLFPYRTEGNRWFHKDDVEIINEEKGMKFTKDMLKTGMRVKYRQGHTGIVLVDIGVVALDSGYNNLSHLTNDFMDNNHSSLEQMPSDWDVVEVYEGYQKNVQVINFDCLGKLLWKREEKSPAQIELEALQTKISELTKQADRLQAVLCSTNKC